MTVDPLGDGEAMGFKVRASGLNARIPQAVPGLLSGETADHPVDAHGIQPLFAGMLARACGLNVAMAANGDGILLTAAPATGCTPAARQCGAGSGQARRARAYYYGQKADSFRFSR